MGSSFIMDGHPVGDAVISTADPPFDPGCSRPTSGSWPPGSAGRGGTSRTTAASGIRSASRWEGAVAVPL